MSSPTPKELIVQLSREQGGPPISWAICPYCRKPGATDPHHFLYKRSDNAPDEVLHTRQNVILVCHPCHDKYGQTKGMTLTCLAFKLRLGYDIFGWVDQLIKDGVVKHYPDIYGCLDETAKKILEDRHSTE